MTKDHCAGPTSGAKPNFLMKRGGTTYFRYVFSSGEREAVGFLFIPPGNALLLFALFCIKLKKTTRVSEDHDNSSSFSLFSSLELPQNEVVNVDQTEPHSSSVHVAHNIPTGETSLHKMPKNLFHGTSLWAKVIALESWHLDNVLELVINGNFFAQAATSLSA